MHIFTKTFYNFKKLWITWVTKMEMNNIDTCFTCIDRVLIFIIHIIQLMEMQCLFKYWCTHILITQWHPLISVWSTPRYLGSSSNTPLPLTTWDHPVTPWLGQSSWGTWLSFCPALPVTTVTASGDWQALEWNHFPGWLHSAHWPPVNRKMEMHFYTWI